MPGCRAHEFGSGAHCDRRDRAPSSNVIRVPTFVIGARDDQLTPRDLFEELARRIPGATLQLLDEGGHLCPLTATEPYNAAVLRFLLARAALGRPQC